MKQTNQLVYFKLSVKTVSIIAITFIALILISSYTAKQQSVVDQLNSKIVSQSRLIKDLDYRITEAEDQNEDLESRISDIESKVDDLESK